MKTSSSTTALVALLSIFGRASAGYTLKDDYSGSNFFSMFDFFTDADPTSGYVDYVAQSAAQSAGLINTNNNQIYMGVDSKNVASGSGRQSVRLTSKAIYNQGLIVLDLEHMPIGCGTWPAFWTVGPDWPANGEIDIIEGVNMQSHNAMTLHTGSGCSIGSGPNTGSSNAAQAFSGSVSTSNCDINAQGQAQNAGCGIATADTSSYGSGLNAIKGGVYATEWNSDGISIWYFPRGKIPSDVDSNPDPTSWGTPYAFFGSSSCNIDTKFKNQQIVFDTTFCGQWAGEVWSTDSTCSAKAATCQEYVQNNPQAFADAYWTVNSLKVYTSDGSVGGNATRSATAGVPTATGSKPPVGSATGSRVPTGPPVGTGVSSPAGGKSSAVSTGSSVPFVPSVVTSKPAAPSTTLATSFQSQNSQQNTWAGHSRSGGWGSRTWQGKYIVHGPPTSLPERPEGITLPPPMRREVFQPENIDAEMVRRHMHRHRRHGTGL